jgi:hypothetical protein
MIFRTSKRGEPVLYKHTWWDADPLRIPPVYNELAFLRRGELESLPGPWRDRQRTPCPTWSARPVCVEVRTAPELFQITLAVLSSFLPLESQPHNIRIHGSQAPPI